MLSTIKETQKKASSHQYKESTNYLSKKTDKVVRTVDRSHKNIDKSISNFRSVQEVTSNFYLSDIKPKLYPQQHNTVKEFNVAHNPGVQHLMDHPLINRQNPLDALKEEKEIIQKLLVELEEQKQFKLKELEEAKLLKKLQGIDLGSVRDIFGDQKNKLVTMIQIAQAENEAIELKIQRSSQSLKQLNDTRDDSNKIMTKYTKEVQRLRDNIHLMEKKNMADLKLVAEKIRHEDDINRRLREDLEKAQLMMNEDERKKKEYYILLQENENLELQIKSLQSTHDNHTQEYQDLQQEYESLQRVQQEEQLKAQQLLDQANLQQDKAIQDKQQLLNLLHQDSLKLASQIQKMQVEKMKESSQVDAQVLELVQQGQQLQKEFDTVVEDSKIRHEDLKLKLQKLDEEQSSQQEKLALLSKIKEDAKKLQKANRDEHDKELQVLRSQIDTSKAEIDGLDEQAKILEKDKDFYEQQLNSDQGVLMNGVDIVVVISQQLESKAQTVEILKKQKEDLNQEIADLEVELNELQERQEQLESEEPKNPKQELDSQLKVQGEVEKNFQDLQEQVKSLRHQISANDENIENNRMQYERYSSMTPDLDKKQIQLRERIGAQEQQLQLKANQKKKKK